VKILKSALGTLLALAVCGLPAVANAQTVFNPRHAVTEVHSRFQPADGGVGPASSFAAASVMGAEGFSNSPVPADFETNIVSGCTAKTKLITNPFSVWPSICNPDGMALFLNQFSPPNPVGEPPVHWITEKSTDQAFIISEVIRGLRDFGSPGIVPVYGQADHWVAITQITVGVTGAVSNVRAFDGGKINGMDSGTNSFFQGLQSWSGIAFRNTFFTLVTAINPSCDNVLPSGCGSPPVNDPFANKFVLMFEPPSNRTSSPTQPATFETFTGVTGKGSMNATIASARVTDALVQAGIHADPQMWNAIKAGTPGQATLVQGKWPNGTAWNYYLVPILSSKNSNSAVAFVHLSADNGAFESANVLNTAVPFAPVSLTRAQDLAKSALGAGETLTGGALTWNPRARTAFASSPNEPYFEFGVAGDKSSAVRVRLSDGAVDRQ
jgi:hypothetical protein